jgi:hypothetical protein
MLKRRKLEMDKETIQLIALNSRILPLMVALESEKQWFLKHLDTLEKNDSNEFKKKKTAEHIQELQYFVAKVNCLLFDDCNQEVDQDPEGILGFLSRNETIKKKIIEKMKEVKDA